MKKEMSNKKAWLWFILYLVLIITGQQLAGIGGIFGAAFIVFGLSKTFRSDKSITKKIIFSSLYVLGGIIMGFIIYILIISVFSGLFKPNMITLLEECRNTYPGTDAGNLFKKETCIFTVIYQNNGDMKDCEDLTNSNEKNECKIAVAALTQDYSLCNALAGDIMQDRTSYKDYCLEVVAFELADLNKCDEIISQEWKDICKINIEKKNRGEAITPEGVWRVLIEETKGTVGSKEYQGQAFKLTQTTNISIMFTSDLPVYTCIANKIGFENFKQGKQYECFGGSINEKTEADYPQGALLSGEYIYFFYTDEEKPFSYTFYMEILD